jgi:hypothetical protein
MEAKQFYYTSISPLVVRTFACKWSEDNRLSVITEKGVHIFVIRIFIFIFNHKFLMKINV